MMLSPRLQAVRRAEAATALPMAHRVCMQLDLYVRDRARESYPMQALPQQFDTARYWQELYRQPLPFWQTALDRIMAAHQLVSSPWTRATLGRNIVFVSLTAVIKLGPPIWSGEMAREAAALNAVAGRLPVATPTLLAYGALDRWDYLVQTPLPGANLHALWAELPPAARAALADQHGTLMAALHAFSLSDIPAHLAFDWQAMLNRQRAECAREMQRAGVADALVQQIEAYLAATPWDNEPPVLLHGDLTHLNMLVVEQAGSWRITGLIDWGDVKLGSRMHEFISPGVHMYQGDAALLAAWYRGYGWAHHDRAARDRHQIMARAMLYYPDDFARLIQAIPGAAQCQDWHAMAAAFWQPAPA
jgi:hygromycin-B 7''-O-kinase